MEDVDQHVLGLICYLLHDRQIKQEVIKQGSLQITWKSSVEKVG